ncbi:MAG: TonB-dependent receptor [Bacteroidales bacterium]|nr:TonB-dependent receptor [Bacteroidales bacterium]
MNRRMKYLFLVTAALLFMATGADAQNSADSLQSGHSENVTIYGTSRPVIRQAFQKYWQPTDYKINIPSGTGSALSLPGAVPTKITLQTMKPEPVDTYVPLENWNNLVRGGFGSRMTPYAELFHSQGKEDSYRWNVHLYHFSSFLNIKNYLPSPHSTTLAETSFKKFFPYHVLSLEAGYRINTLRYYGYNTLGDTLTYNKNNDQLKQLYQLGSASVSFGDTYRNFDKLHYQITAKGYYFGDRFGMDEWHADARFDVHKAFEVTNVFNHQQLGVEGNYSFYREKNTYQTRRDNFLSLLPYFDARYGIFSLRAGVHVEWLQALGKKLYAYPFLNVRMNIIPEAFSLFAGVDGGLKKNSYYSLVTANPFLYSFDNSYQWENDQFSVHAGFNGNFARRLGFEMEAGVKYFKNKAFFDYVWSNTYRIPASDSVMRFVKNAFYVSYANGNVFYISGGLSYENAPNVKVWLTGKYQEFQLDNGMKPLYEPDLEVQLGSSVRVTKKASGWIQAAYVGERWAAHRFLSGGSVVSNPYYRLPAYVDVNLGGNYRFDKQLSGFVKVTNLLNKQYWQFNEYPVAGIEVMLGASYRF